MIDSESLQSISEIIQMFSLTSISKEKGWEGLLSMELYFGNYGAEFWLGSNVSKSFGQPLIPNFQIRHNDEDSVIKRFYTRGFVGFFNGEISLFTKRSK